MFAAVVFQSLGGGETITITIPSGCLSPIEKKKFQKVRDIARELAGNIIFFVFLLDLSIPLIHPFKNDVYSNLYRAYRIIMN